MTTPKRMRDANVSAALEGITTLVETLEGEVRELAGVSERNSSSIANLDGLAQALRGTHPLGGDGVGARLNKFDDALASGKDAVKQLADRVKALEASDAEDRKDRRRVVVQVVVAVISALTAVACAIISLSAHKAPT